MNYKNCNRTGCSFLLVGRVDLFCHFCYYVCMKIIKFDNICKTFKISIRDKGVWGAIKGLFKRKYKKIEALKNVSFEVEQGDIVGYIGPNGAGKSTTIKIMSGILNPTSGECEIDGFCPYKQRKEYVKNIGVVFGQRSQLWWDVPVVESFELLKDIYKIPQKDYDENLALLCKTLDLDDLLMRPLRQLSLGQKMKCELAGALLHKPKILFLDEPTIGLDAVSKLAVRDFVKYINKEWGTTIILTTHDMNDIETLTNKIILIGRGQILYNGSFSAIKEKYGQTKTIKVQFSKAYDSVELEDYIVVSHQKNTAVLQNKLAPFHAKDFIAKLSEKYDVVDFSVEGISIDEVLAKLYKDYNL